MAMNDCSPRCTHFDCMMDRGDVLPSYVTAYTVVDGTPILYVPSAAAIARHAAAERARELYEIIEAALAPDLTVDVGPTCRCVSTPTSLK